MERETKGTVFWFLILIFVIVTFIFFIPTIEFYKNYHIQQEINEKLKKLNTSPITEEDIISICNNSNKEKIILCLNNIHKKYVNYDNCKNRSYTLKPLQFINLGKGCCRDSAEYYHYFLDKFDIPNQQIYTPPKPKATHTYIIATLTSNNTHVDYKLDEDDLTVIFYYNETE